MGGAETAQPSTSKTEEFFEAFEPSLNFIQRFEGKNVLITGATGGIGSQVVRKLLISSKPSAPKGKP